MEYGFWALIPPLIVIVLSIMLRSSFEPLLLGCLAGFMIIAWKTEENFFDGFISSMYRVMMDESTVWVILVCGLYGSLISLLIRSGGATRFGEWLLEKVRSRRAALLGTWMIGIAIFLDDYLSALTVGVTMKKITDHFKVAREYLAYIVNTTAAPVSVLVPISTWTLFISSILEKSSFAAEGEGNLIYLSVIPFVAYGWVSVLLIPAVILGWVPLMGKMKRAQQRAESTGQVIPDGRKFASLHLDAFSPQRIARVQYFVIPLLVLLGSTLILDFDALKGVMIAVVFTFLYFLIIKLATFHQLSETVFAGFNSMVFALALVVVSYVLKDVGDQMHLTEFVIGGVKPVVSREWLPAIIFVSISFISWATGSSWGIYAVVIPIVIPLAQSLGSSVLMNIGAVVSAGVFGANACLYSDATILTAQSTDTNNINHALSQLPLALLAFGVSIVVYVLMGYVF